MKKLAASVSVIALGASTITPAFAVSPMVGDASKPWSISATLRGFYDDNIFTSHDNKTDSFGFEINPSFSVGATEGQTSVGATYNYSGRWFEEVANGTTGHWRHQHLLEGVLQHDFSAQVSANIKDSFGIGQEPDYTRAKDVVNTPFEVPGNNMRNLGTIAVNYQMTPLLGFEVSYGNNYFNYADKNPATTTNGFGDVVIVSPSLSGTQDRVEHQPHLNSRWQLAPQTVGILGYGFSQVHYTGDEFVSGSYIPSDPIQNIDGQKSSDRDYRSHYGYVGVEHSFSPSLTGAVNGGIRYTEFYNSVFQETDTGPYVTASLSYKAAADTTLNFQFTEDFSSSDIVGTQDEPVRGYQNATFDAWISHRLLAALYATLRGTYQNSSVIGGGVSLDGKTTEFYSVGLNLEYKINEHMSVQVGYNHDALSSEASIRPSYDRNQCYIGATASY